MPHRYVKVIFNHLEMLILDPFNSKQCICWLVAFSLRIMPLLLHICYCPLRTLSISKFSCQLLELSWTFLLEISPWTRCVPVAKRLLALDSVTQKTRQRTVLDRSNARNVGSNPHSGHECLQSFWPCVGRVPPNSTDSKGVLFGIHQYFKRVLHATPPKSLLHYY
jgi:hypothetical protein